MIKKLRRRIILVNMLLVGIVILMIFTVMSVNSFSNSVHELERGLSQLIDRNNSFNKNDIGAPESEIPAESGTDNNFKPFLIKSTADNPGHNPEDNHGETDSERPVQLSAYIIVSVDKDGNITDTDESSITMDEADLETCVGYVLSQNKSSGEIGDYGLMYVMRENMDGYKISFADNSSIYSTLRNTLILNTGLFIGSMAVIFLISLVLSGFAVKPVKSAWQKQKQFVADASHELKTPLTVILANNNIMMSHTESSVRDERQWLESTEEEAQHMKKLIDQMLFLAKSDAGESNLDLSDVNFSEIVEGASLNFEPVAFEKGVLIDTDIQSDITIHGNALQLNQLTHILIDNAVKYSSDNSTVKINLIKKGDNVEFSVNNHGSVIAEDELEHIFDRFYRAEKSRTTKGYGLGLSIAQNIVQSMNGKIWAQSNEKDGTTFTALFK